MLFNNSMSKTAKLLKEKDLFNLDDSNNYCKISYEKFNINKPVVKLLCGHTFYYDNIVTSYSITNKCNDNYIGKRICPYCRSKGGFLPHINGDYIKGVHFRKSTKLSNPRKLSIKCSAKYETGSKKGLQCECKGNPKYFKITKKGNKKFYCGKHKKYADLNLNHLNI